MHIAKGGGEDGSAPKGDRHGGSDNLEAGGHHLDLSNAHKKFSDMGLRITVVFVVVSISCVLLFQSSYPFEFFHKPFSFPDSKISSPPRCSNSAEQTIAPMSSLYQDASQNLPTLTEKEESNELEKTLNKAAMKDNKTVIITTLNTAWTEPNSIFDLFLESFKIGNGTQDLLKHVVVGAFDRTAYHRCLEKGLHCVAVTTEGVNFSGEAYFMTEDYLKMVWRKIDFQRSILESGFDMVFTDADVMWLRNPFERFYEDGDFQIACDHYWFTSTDLNNSPNSGFIYVRSNNRTIQFYKYWYAGREYFPGKHDQDVLNYIKMNPFVSNIGLKFRFFDSAYFGGFCEPSKDLDLVITMHANCCIGMGNKIHDIKMVIDDWKRYVSSPPDQRNSTVRSWTVPRICG